MKTYVLVVLSSLFVGMHLQAAASSESSLTRHAGTFVVPDDHTLATELDVLAHFVQTENYDAALRSAHKALEMFPEDRRSTMQAVIGQLHIAGPHKNYAQAEAWFKEAARSDATFPEVRAVAEQGLREILSKKIDARRRNRHFIDWISH